jgi:serine/threonine protein kinase
MLIRTKFARVLRSIHEAGVVHRDIRHPNLLISEDDEQVFFIDFDRAVFNPSTHAQHVERDEFLSLAGGLDMDAAGYHHPTPPSYVSSPYTVRSSSDAPDSESGETPTPTRSGSNTPQR